jgi:two-component sensor histidine kinase
MPRETPKGLQARSTGHDRPWRLHAIDALLFASVLLPALIFGAAALYDRNQTMAATERKLLSTLDMLHGHAEKVFQFQALALGTIQERLRSQRDEEVLAAAASHHDFLRAVRRHADETLGIVIIGADGRPLVDSDQPQAPRHIDASDREYFRWHRDHPGPEPRVAGLIRSRADDEPVFFMTARRSAEDGSFLGVITVGVQQSTFIGYWNRTAPLPDALVNLTRADGAILARRPPVEPGTGIGTFPIAPLTQAIQTAAERVVIEGTSPLDGVERMVAYRRLDRFPVTVAYGVPRATMLSRWRRRLLIYGGFALVTGLALSSLALMARRRARELNLLNATLERRVEARTADIQASEARVRLLAREVDHRAKNTLAVVQATLRLTPKHDAVAYAKAVEGRIAALARAQTLLSEDRWRGASLQALLKAELVPFAWEDGGELGPRAEVDGPPVLLPPSAAQPLAMAAHELATNAIKHGALSVPGGRVRVTWRLTKADDAASDALALRWEETGGPPVPGPPTRRGFGSRVLESIVRGQLGGSFLLTWAPTGVVCDIKIPLARLASGVPQDNLSTAA